MKKHYYLIILLIASFLSVHCVQAQNVNIPDATFKASLVANTAINTNLDGEIQTTEAEAYTGTIGGGLGINNLTGVEAFINATGFDCEFNNVSVIDLTHNTKLTNIRISDCQVTSLDLSLNSLLDNFYCYNCPLATINVPANTIFTFFLCQNTLITSLDVSHNITFAFFNCGLNSKLANLNIKNGHNTQLTNFYALGNPLLTCIQVDDPAYMDANWGTKKDASASYNAICSNNAYNVNIPDANFLAALVTNPDINTDGDGAIQVSEAMAFTGTLDVSNQSISDLTGIEAFTGITALYCNNNQITSLDASACINLQNLQCQGNQLTNLNIPLSNVLDYLDCSDNQIINLDVSANTALTQLNCSNNQIVNLNVSNCGQLVNLFCGQNKLINTIDLSNNSLLIGLTCNTNQLTTLDISNNPLLQTLDCSQNQISTLQVSSNAQLVSLACSDNLLTALIVSSNHLLTSLTCGFNPLSNLDLTQNPALSYLEFSNTNIPDIDLHANANLTFVACTQGHLTSLDVSSCPLLTNLNCQANAIASLNLSACSLLNTLICHGNQLTDLDLSANPQLTQVYCENNPLLTTVNIKNGNNSNLVGFDLIDNPSLYCIQVDDAAYMNANWSAGKDITASYNTNCASPGAALRFDGIDDYVGVSGGGGLNDLQSGTIEMWVKWNGSNQDGADGSLPNFGPVLSRQSDFEFSNQIIALSGPDPKTATIVWKPYNAISNAITGSTSPANGWNHIAIVYSSGGHQLYLNGVLDGSGTETGVMGNNTAVPLSIGGWTGQGVRYGNADIDEVRIWNVMKTQAEIQASMHCELPAGTPGLLANYHFNQGIASADNTGETTLNDASGNGQNGAVNNFSLNGSSSNWISQGGVASGTSCVPSCPSYFASLDIEPGYPSTICPGESTNLAVNITGASPSNTYFDISYFDGVSTYVTNRVFVTGSNVTAAFSVSPTATTNYKLISIADASGCSGLIGPATSDTFELVNICQPVISIADKRITEGNSGTTLAKFKVSLSSASTSTVTVNYSTADSTATAGSDYVAKSGKVKFNPGQTSKTISITINGDKQVEPNEKIKVLLTAPVNATIADNLGVGTIKNDDVAAIASNSTTSDAAVATNISLKVSPNPAKDQVIISGLSAGNSNFIELTDLSGRSLLKQKVTDNTQTITIGKYASGIYLLRYYDGIKMQQIKVVKE
ncbi:LamG-like jellyroll fold domain-containing protein [Limnovirga soli]|uniref:T9SS type A sorting domain-containing protein n=1 Tax=Limnovirga soli TaxID=2656915 RepID=A0A8J8FFL0_9BACT|nr:LamG-like jellyroll fold domain-containing protein [Limnovirga soli]NNV54204.1 T9SS type A sorting domain-containing protein [Limnovirga soli]